MTENINFNFKKLTQNIESKKKEKKKEKQN